MTEDRDAGQALEAAIDELLQASVARRQHLFGTLEWMAADALVEEKREQIARLTRGPVGATSREDDAA